MRTLSVILLVLVLLASLSACAPGADDEDLIETPSLEEVENAYAEAVEAFSWFQLSTLPIDDSAPAEADSVTYYRVTHKSIQTLADLESHLLSLFSADIVENLLESDADIPLYHEFEGELYAIPADRGTDMYKGDETLSVTQEGDMVFLCTVEVQLLDEDDLDSVVGYETHEFLFEFTGDKWTFTNFHLVR